MSLPFYTGQIPTADDFNALMPKADLSASSGASHVGFKQAGANTVERTVEEKLREIVSPFDFGAVGDGVTDDATAVQDAIDEANTRLIGNSFATVDLGGYTYGIGATLNLKSGVILRNGSLVAVGSTLTATDPLVSIENTENTCIRNVRVDCSSLCAGILRNTAKRSELTGVRVYYFKTYGVKDTGVTQESLINHIDIKQWLWPDPERKLAAERTAIGLWVDTSDSLYENVVCATCDVPLLVSAGFNKFTNIHVYNGGVLDSAPQSICMQLTTPNPNSFTNLYVDDGVCQLIDSFSHNFNNVLFQHNALGTNTKGLELITSAAGEKAYGLSLNNVLFNGTYSDGRLVFSVTGSGSWAGETGFFLSNFRTTDGASTNTAIAKWWDKAALANDGSFNLLDATSGSYKIGGVKVVGVREAGWTAATGTPNKGAYATYAGQTASAVYDQAEAQATDDATKANSQRIKAIEDALRTHGLIN